MRWFALPAVVLLSLPCLARAQGDEARARQIAQEVLDRGAALFDTRDAAAMAATYVETGQLVVIKRDSDSATSTVETAQGREAIRKAYADLFKDRLPEHRCRNTVDQARWLGPNLLLIQGRFALDREQGDSIQFVQIRTRQGDQWKIATLQIMQLADQNP